MAEAKAPEADVGTPVTEDVKPTQEETSAPETAAEPATAEQPAKVEDEKPTEASPAAPYVYPTF